MRARAAGGLFLIALAVPAMAQTTLTIDELRQKADHAKTAYKGYDPAGFAKSIDSAISSLQAQYGDQVPAIAAIRTLLIFPLAERATAAVYSKSAEGVTVEQTLAGFELRAVNRSFISGLFWLVLIAVLCAIPFRVFPDLLREIVTGEGVTLWLGGAFLAAYAAVLVYFAWSGARSAFGEVRITRAGDDGAIFTGIGSIGRTQHFHWSDFRGTGEQAVAVDTGRRFTRTEYYVALAGSGKHVRLGNDLTDAQRAFIVAYLREQVFEPHR